MAKPKPVPNPSFPRSQVENGLGVQGPTSEERADARAYKTLAEVTKECNDWSERYEAVRVERHELRARLKASEAERVEMGRRLDAMLSIAATLAAQLGECE